MDINRSMVKRLLGFGDSPLCVDTFGRTPLHCLTKRWDDELAQMLIDAMRDVAPPVMLYTFIPDDARDCRGWTPMHYAYTVEGPRGQEMRSLLFRNGFSNKKK